MVAGVSAPSPAAASTASRESSRASCSRTAASRRCPRRPRAPRDGAGRGTDHAWHHARRDREGRNGEAGRDRRATPWAARPERRRRSPTATTIRTKWVSSFVGVVPARGPAAGRSSSSSTSRRAGTWAARWRRRSSRRSPSRRCATCTCRRPRRWPCGDGKGCRRQGGGEGRGRAAKAAGRRRRGGRRGARDGPAAGRRRAGRRSGAGREVGRGRRRRGRRGPSARRPSGSIVPDFVGHEPGPGDPRRAQERRRAGLRRSGGTRDRRGAAPAAGAGPGAAGRGLPRGVRAQGMTRAGVHARAACWRGSTARACAATRRVRDRRGARRLAAGRAAAICSSRCPATVVDGAQVPRRRGRRAAPRRWWSRASRRPSWPIFAGVVVGGAERAARAGRHRAQPLSARRGARRCSAVTGTNGKTTTTYLVEAMLRAAGVSPGVVGTVIVPRVRACRAARGRRRTRRPGALMLHELFAEMRAGGATDVVLEATSHALAQGRVAGCAFRVAALTNLTQDHLDYHGDDGALRGRQGDPVRAADRSARAASR